MPSTVQTTRGPVPVDDLGTVDYHEHLYVEPPGWLHRIDPDFALDDVDKSAEELASWAGAGGRTLVEMTAVDFGRDIRSIAAVADRVPDVKVIVTAGYNRPYYMGRWLHAVAEDDMVRDTVRDLTQGIDGTSIRAGVIKAGSEYNNFNDAARKLFRVAARAHLETGAPIITHTTAGTMGLEQVSFLADQGVEPHRVALSHMDRNPDPGYHLSVAASGAYLGYDCFGKAKYGPDSDLVALLRAVVDGGGAHQVLLGNDIGRPSYWRAYGGGPGLDYVLTRFIPRLRKEGFGASTIQALLVDNPRRFLAGDVPTAGAQEAAASRRA
jgi:5-phospho-D-xylono-1,4-lactonase